MEKRLIAAPMAFRAPALSYDETQAWFLTPNWLLLLKTAISYMRIFLRIYSFLLVIFDIFIRHDVSRNEKQNNEI